MRLFDSMFATRTSSGVKVACNGTGEVVTINRAPNDSTTTLRMRSRSSTISPTVSRWNDGASASNTCGCGICR